MKATRATEAWFCRAYAFMSTICLPNADVWHISEGNIDYFLLDKLLWGYNVVEAKVVSESTDPIDIVNVWNVDGYRHPLGQMAFILRKGIFVKHIVHEVEPFMEPGEFNGQTFNNAAEFYALCKAAPSDTETCYDFGFFWRILALHWDYDAVCASFLAWMKAVHAHQNMATVKIRGDLTFQTAVADSEETATPWQLSHTTRNGPPLHYLAHILLKMAAGKNMTGQQLTNIQKFAQKLLNDTASDFSTERLAELERHPLFDNVRGLDRLPISEFNHARETVVAACHHCLSHPAKVHELLSQPSRITASLDGDQLVIQRPRSSLNSEEVLPRNLPYVNYPLSVTEDGCHLYSGWGIQLAPFRRSDPLWSDAMSARVMRIMLEYARGFFDRTGRYPAVDLDHMLFTTSGGVQFAEYAGAKVYADCRCTASPSPCFNCFQEDLVKVADALFNSSNQREYAAVEFEVKLGEKTFKGLEQVLAHDFLAKVKLSSNKILGLIPSTAPAPTAVEKPSPKLMDRLAMGITTKELIRSVLHFALVEITEGRNVPAVDDIYMDDEGCLYQKNPTYRSPAAPWRSSVRQLLMTVSRAMNKSAIPEAVGRLIDRRIPPGQVLTESFHSPKWRVSLAPLCLEIPLDVSIVNDALYDGKMKCRTLREILETQHGFKLTEFRSIVDALIRTSECLSKTKRHLQVWAQLDSFCLCDDGKFRCKQLWAECRRRNKSCRSTLRSIASLAVYVVDTDGDPHWASFIRMLRKTKFASVKDMAKHEFLANNLQNKMAIPASECDEGRQLTESLPSGMPSCGKAQNVEPGSDRPIPSGESLSVPDQLSSSKSTREKSSRSEEGLKRTAVPRVQKELGLVASSPKQSNDQTRIAQSLAVPSEQPVHTLPSLNGTPTSVDPAFNERQLRQPVPTDESLFVPPGQAPPYEEPAGTGSVQPTVSGEQFNQPVPTDQSLFVPSGQAPPYEEPAGTGSVQPTDSGEQFNQPVPTDQSLFVPPGQAPPYEEPAGTGSVQPTVSGEQFNQPVPTDQRLVVPPGQAPPYEEPTGTGSVQPAVSGEQFNQPVPTDQSLFVPPGQAPPYGLPIPTATPMTVEPTSSGQQFIQLVSNGQGFVPLEAAILNGQPVFTAAPITVQPTGSGQQFIQLVPNGQGFVPLEEAAFLNGHPVSTAVPMIVQPTVSRLQPVPMGQSLFVPGGDALVGAGNYPVMSNGQAWLLPSISMNPHMGALSAIPVTPLNSHQWAPATGPPTATGPPSAPLCNGEQFVGPNPDGQLFTAPAPYGWVYE